MDDLIEGWGPLGIMTGRTKREAIEKKLISLKVTIHWIGCHPAAFRSEYNDAIRKLREKK